MVAVWAYERHRKKMTAGIYSLTAGEDGIENDVDWRQQGKFIGARLAHAILIQSAYGNQSHRHSRAPAKARKIIIFSAACFFPLRA